MALDLYFPPKLECLFKPARFIVLYGGRGAGRSWGVARSLLIRGMQQPLRILCARELQHSLDDSVKKLLADQITLMGKQDPYVEQVYDIKQAYIKNLENGTEFSFEGIRHNVTKIKSYEGVDICWVEEADQVTKESWDVLTPTIRKPGSQIIMTFNPRLERDYTYQNFVIKPRTNSIVVKSTYLDNPWFPDILKADMEDMKREDYDTYLHVWEGFPRQQLEGAIYADELREAQAQNRICKVPYDRSVPVDVSFDIGRSDHTSVWFSQRVSFEKHLIDFYQNNQKHLDHYLKVLQDRGYVYGTIWLPHDAKAKTLGTKLSIEEQVRAKFPRGAVRIVPKLSIEDGINAGRTVFPQCYFDDDRCSVGLHALRHYRYDMDPGTKLLSNKPKHDEHSDAADAFRYFAIGSKIPGRRQQFGEAVSKLLSPNEWTGFEGFGPIRSGPPGQGWMG